MDPRLNLQQTDSLPEGWKWSALFSVPETLQPTWRAWLAEAQRAEEQAVLRYWAQRAGNNPGQLDQAA